MENKKALLFQQGLMTLITNLRHSVRAENVSFS